MAYHSQFGEDKWIWENIISVHWTPPMGTFCEVGAFDGIASSNTLHFEECGWKGVCIEAVPHNAALCMYNRNAVTWCCACGHSGLRPFFMDPKDMGIGGLNRTGTAFPVVVCGLEELVVASGFQNINLLSIDTEGTEFDVWNTRGRLSPEIVIIEHWTQPHPSNADDIVARMKLDGYKEIHRTEANLIFVGQEYQLRESRT